MPTPASNLHPIFDDIFRAFTAPRATVPAAPAPSANPFERARLALIARLLKERAPGAISLRRPRLSEFEAVADHIRDMANIFDEWLREIGSEVADNAHEAVDMRQFTGTFLAAVDGNATFEVCEAGLSHRSSRED